MSLFSPWSVFFFASISVQLAVAAEECAVNKNVPGVLDGSANLLQSKLGQMRTGPSEETSGNAAELLLYTLPVPLAENFQRGMVIMEHRMVGCFPRSDDDPSNLTQKYLDWSCVSSNTSLCHSGLPFFRLPLREGQSFLDCFSFCLSKGMDLFGVLAMDRGGGDVEECRCGASKANLAAWHGNEPRPQLLLPSMGVDNDDPSCAMVVWQYTGGFENDGVPSHLFELTETELIYMDSIAAGRMVSEGLDEDDLPIVTTKGLLQTGANGELAHKSVCADGKTGYNLLNPTRPLTCEDVLKGNGCAKAGKAQTSAITDEMANLFSAACPFSCKICTKIGLWSPEPCYPNSCGGTKTWQNKNGEGKVVVNYFFDEESLSTRTSPAINNTKAAFRSAAEAYPLSTCIELVEGTGETAPEPRISVGFYDPPVGGRRRQCWAKQTNSMTSAGYKFNAQINLGWCNDAQHRGNMIHEISHVLGVSHEQKRPDAQATISLPSGDEKGPHLTMHWEHIGTDWVSQYLPASSSYVGSDDQGGDDQFSGYAPYDFESLMHYGRLSGTDRNHKFSTVNPVFNTVVGQRTKFSEGDILQLNDMYQCSAPTPAPTPAPPSSHPTPASSNSSSIGLHTVTPAPAAAAFVQGTTSSTNAPRLPKGLHVDTAAPAAAAFIQRTTSSTNATPLLLPLAPTWNAGAWSSCQPRQHHLHAGNQWSGQCNAGCVITRQVTCKNTSTSADLSEASCQANFKLAKSEECECSTTTCQDKCNPGFLSASGEVLVCTNSTVEHWCTKVSVDDPLMSATVRERCPRTCGLCA